MLPKKNRASRKALGVVFKEGKFINSPSLTFKFILKSGVKEPQTSFIVPKSVAKSAVKRNSLRRLGYKALEGVRKVMPTGIIGAFIFKKPIDDVEVIANEIEGILNKIR